MKAVIDRIEGHFAVVETEDRRMVNMPMELLPADAREGDVLSIEIDGVETAARQKRITAFTKKLRENN